METSMNALVRHYIDAKRRLEKSGEDDAQLNKNLIRNTLELDEVVRKTIIDQCGEDTQNFIVVKQSSRGTEYFTDYKIDMSGNLESVAYAKEEDQALEILLSKVLEVVKATAYDNAETDVSLKIYPSDNDQCVLTIDL